MALSLSALLIVAPARAQDIPPFSKTVMLEERDSFGHYSPELDLLPSDARTIPLALRLSDDQRAAFIDLYDGYLVQRRDAGTRMREYLRSVNAVLEIRPDDAALRRQQSETWKKYYAHCRALLDRFYADLRTLMTPEQEARWESIERITARAGLTQYTAEGFSPGQTADAARIAARVMQGERASENLLDALDRYELDVARPVNEFLAWRAEMWEQSRALWAPGSRATQEEADRFRAESLHQARIRLHEIARVSIEHAPRIAAAMPPEIGERFLDEFYLEAVMGSTAFRHSGFDFEDIIRRAVALSRGTEQEAPVQEIVSEYRREIRQGRIRALKEMRTKEAELLAAGPLEKTFQHGGMPGPGWDFATEQYRLGLKMIERLRSVLTDQQLEFMPSPLGSREIVPPVFE